MIMNNNRGGRVCGLLCSFVRKSFDALYEDDRKKFKFTVPHVFVILAIIMLLVFIVSFFVPSGNFERVLDENSGREIVNPDVFNWVEKQYLTFSDYFQSFYNGIVGGIAIMGNLLICSGVLGFLESTGAFSAGIHKLVRATKGKEISLVVIMYVLFTVFGVLGYSGVLHGQRPPGQEPHGHPAHHLHLCHGPELLRSLRLRQS